MSKNSHYLGQNKSLLVTDRGDRMIVDTRDMMISPSLLCWGSWESETAKALDQHLRPGMRWIDIGANIGYFTVIGRRIVGSAGFTYAFEANPHTYSLLSDNVALNWFWDSIKLEQKAVHSESGALRFVAPVKYAVNATTGAKDSEDWTAVQDQVHVFNVDSVRLDDYLDKNERVDLIKIDIEGAELDALRGARKTLERLRDIKLMVEWSPGQMAECGHSIDAAIREIKDQGFCVTVMEGVNERLELDDLHKIQSTTMLLLQRTS